METRSGVVGGREGAFVSTGSLPPRGQIAALVAEAHERYRGNSEGATSQVYPALARVPPGLFGVCVAGVNGNVYSAGDADVEFTIMSVSKPLVFALVCEALGPEPVRDKLGVNATGLAFNSLAAIEQGAGGRTNPMVNPGAIAATSLAPGTSAEEKWQCSLTVSARDLAVMGATLADGGVNPLTRERVIDAATCRYVLAVMTTAGLYETSGDWLYDVGLPGKSGIGGGIVTVAPGKGGLGTFAPLLDDAGTSVKGRLAARFLSTRLGLDLFASRPV